MGESSLVASPVRMKAVFLLGAFALALVASLEQTENKNVAAPSDNLLRDTRDASAKKSGKKKGPARKKRKNTGQRKRKGQKGKGKKTKNKNRRARKRKKERGAKRLKEENGTEMVKNLERKIPKNLIKSKKTLKVNPRQSQCSNDFLKYAPKFNTRNENMKRRARRVAGWLGIMDKKAGNAATAFEDAKNALSAATNDGTSCMSGGTTQTDAFAALTLLKNCSASAAEACKSSDLGVDIATMDGCSNKDTPGTLDNYQTEITKCIESFSGSACDCKADFEKAIGSIPAGAEKTCWDTIEAKYDEVKAAKKACANKGGPSGSFFNCMSAVKASPGQISGCGITM